MAWVQLFPTNNTLISQSVNQIQQNWLFIQQNIGTDHFFNTGAPTEGHHQFVHLPTQGADPAVILTGVIYQKVNTGGAVRLYYRNASEISQIPTCITGVVNLPVGLGPFVVYNFAGAQTTQGFIMIKEVGNVAARTGGFYMWDGAGAINQVYTNGGATAITALQFIGTSINITKTNAAMIVEYSILEIKA